MAIPSSKVPQWNATEVNMAAPSVGEETVGFPVGAAATSASENYIRRRLSMWTRYLAETIHEEELPLIIGPDEFRSDQQPEGVYKSQLGYTTFTGLPGVGVAAATIPTYVGARIARVQFFYDPAGGGSMTPELRWVTMNAPGAGTLVPGAGGTADAVAGNKSQTLTPTAPHIIAAGTYVIIRCLINGAANRIHGARVDLIPRYKVVPS